MLESVQEYIKANPAPVMWLLIVLIIYVAWIHFDGKKKSHKKSKGYKKELSSGKLPDAEESDSSIDGDLVAELQAL